MKIWLWNMLLFIKLFQIVKKKKFNEITIKKNYYAQCMDLWLVQINKEIALIPISINAHTSMTKPFFCNSELVTVRQI